MLWFSYRLGVSSIDPWGNLISISRYSEGTKLIQRWCFEVEPLKAGHVSTGR